MEIEIKTSADGSSTLYRPDLDEHYHSINGAISESLHIFINAGLYHCQSNPIHILEVGFGTGLNALLTAVGQNDKHIIYHSVEKFPVNKVLIDGVNYPNLIESPLAEEIFQKLHNAAWDYEVSIIDNFKLKKISGDLCDFNAINQYNLVYFDAFAPEKQPELWTTEIFQKIYDAMQPNGILTTYCSKGVVRRTMQSVGFKVERLCGPTGKREILRAIKQ